MALNNVGGNEVPINIYRHEADKNEPVAKLCAGIWELPDQLDALERWITGNKDRLPQGSYVADIGFSPRPAASGGGGVMTASTMQVLASIGINVFFSEYP